MRWIFGSSLKPRIVMAGLAMLLMIFGCAYMGFTRMHHGPVSALPKFSRPRLESQGESLALSAQEAETLAAAALEADLLDDEVSWNERGIGECVSSKAPSLNPVGRCPAGGELLIAVPDFSSRDIPLRI